jgi:hypothetical protein
MSNAQVPLFFAGCAEANVSERIEADPDGTGLRNRGLGVQASPGAPRIYFIVQ